MNIIVEGPDNSGKSTLVECIAKVLNWPIVTSPGPAKSVWEFNERARRSFMRNHVIFDRHCIVSERIYGAARGEIMLDSDLEQAFYHSSHIIVYCYSTAGLEGHVVKPHDDINHLSLIEAKKHLIHTMYDQWALQHANIIYRKGDTPMRVVRFIMGEHRL